MLIQAIGSGLPAALGVALSPFPIVGVILILTGPNSRRNGALFAVGWVAGVAVVAAVTVALFAGADDPGSTSAALADWLRVLAGAGLMLLGVRKWLTRPREGDAEKVPAWMQHVQSADAGRALGLGVALAGANPKNLILISAASTAMIETGIEGSELAIAVAVFVVLASSTVLGAVALHLVGGQRAEGFLDGARSYMVAHSATIMTLVLLLLGANVLGGGLYGLGR